MPPPLTPAPRDAPRFGVNYTPSQGWFHHWLDFDLDPVRADLDSIAALGLDHVRVFPLWPVFQPNRALIRPRAVEQLVSLVDAAAERGLDVAVDGLQGHLSSFDFRPSWTLTWHRRNLFTDPEVLDGQAAYLRTLASALADRPNFLGMTLGNEINQFSGDPHPDPDRITPGEAESWLRRMLGSASGRRRTAASARGVRRRLVPGRPSLHARPLGPDRRGDGRPLLGLQRHGPAPRRRLGGDRSARRVPDRAVEGLGRGPGAPGVAAGGGGARPAHRARPGRRLHPYDGGGGARLPGPLGITWWCSHDVDRSLADFPNWSTASAC